MEVREYNLTADDIAAEMEALGVTDMSVVCDWAQALYDDHGNTITVYPTPQPNMFMLLWTEIPDIDKTAESYSEKEVYSSKHIMAVNHGDATKFVEWLRENHPS